MESLSLIDSFQEFKEFKDIDRATLMNILESVFRSTIKRPADQKRTMEALGLRKMNQSNELNDSPQIRGMIRKVSHLIKVEE